MRSSCGEESTATDHFGESHDNSASAVRANGTVYVTGHYEHDHSNVSIIIIIIIVVVFSGAPRASTLTVDQLVTSAGTFKIEAKLLPDPHQLAKAVVIEAL